MGFYFFRKSRLHVLRTYRILTNDNRNYFLHLLPGAEGLGACVLAHGVNGTPKGP